MNTSTFMWIFCIQKGEKLSNFKGSKTWRLVLLFSVFALVVVACGGDTAEEPAAEEATDTTAAPATTAAAAEEAAPSGPDGVYKMAIFSDPQTQNFWNYYDTNNDVWTGYVMSGQAVSLFGVSMPNYVLVASMASELVETGVDNGDGTYTWTVPIAQGYEWSDGSPITANDWVFTYNTVKNLGLAGNWLSSWSVSDGSEGSIGVIDVVAVDDYTVAITQNYDAGLSGWQYSVALAPVLPESYWGQYATDRETLLAAPGDAAPVAGAFVYDKIEQGAFYTWSYDTNTMYFGGETTIYQGGTRIVQDNGVAPAVDASFGDTTGDSFTYANGPYVGRVEFTLYGDQDAAYLAFQNGEVDFVLNPLGVKRNTWEQLAKSGAEQVSNFSNGMRYMAFNMRIFPGSDKAFRQAVGCIVDKEFIINNVLQGVAINMDGQMPEALSAWVAPVTGVLADCDGLSAEERFNKSIEILQAGGWTATDWGSHPGGADRAVAPTGLKGPGGTALPSETMLLYAPGPGYDPIRSTFSLFIADWMQQLGFDVVARPTGFSVIVDKVFTPENCKDWYFYMLGWGLGSFPDHPDAFFNSANDVCEGGFNTPGYNNPEFDALAADFSAAKTVAEAQAISKAMEALLFEDMPYLVLVTTPILEVYRSEDVSFPFTTVLDGLTQTGSGYPGEVKK